MRNIEFQNNNDSNYLNEWMRKISKCGNAFSLAMENCAAESPFGAIYEWTQVSRIARKVYLGKA